MLRRAGRTALRGIRRFLLRWPADVRLRCQTVIPGHGCGHASGTTPSLPTDDLRPISGRPIIVSSYRDSKDQLDAPYASGRLRLPFEGVLLFGY
jgi:hypothetical protein